MEELRTIDELAAVTKVPTRTIRQYQTLGLLAPPSRVGRVGRYGPSHRDRLAAIARLAERGYSLAGMRDLFDAWESGRELRSVVGFDTEQPEAPIDEASMWMNHGQLIAVAPAFVKPANRQVAIRAGLIRRGPAKTQWIVSSPAALAMIADLIASGVPVSKAVALFEKLKQGLDEIGTVVVTELTAIGTVQNRTALLQRNRARLGKAAATLLITAIGDSLPGDEADRIRIGAIEDRR